MDLYIKFDRGSMAVHLDEFLSCRSISKVRKLVKLIRESGTPGEIEKIQVFIEQEASGYEEAQRQDWQFVTGYESKIKYSEKQIENCLYNRARFKRNTDAWNHYNDYVKAFRSELSTLKTSRRNRLTRINNREKNKVFYEKVLEIITQGW